MLQKLEKLDKLDDLEVKIELLEQKVVAAVALGQRVAALEEEMPKLEATIYDELQLRETKKKNLVVYGFQEHDGDSDRTAITKLLDVVGVPVDFRSHHCPISIRCSPEKGLVKC